MNNRSSVLSVVMYLAVAATLVGGIGVALTAVASSVVSQESVARAKTPFEIQLDSAREVREAVLQSQSRRPSPCRGLPRSWKSPLRRVALCRLSATPNLR
jgi:hypothetical protein